jgi:hypothetical protein
VFYCERCESKFNPTVAAAAGGCPRCRESDGVAAPLRFRIFDRAALKRLSHTTGVVGGRTAK